LDLFVGDQVYDQVSARSLEPVTDLSVTCPWLIENSLKTRGRLLSHLTQTNV